jgi:hypothetical protein
MARAAASTFSNTLTLIARVLEMAAPAKPTQPLTVGVASDGLRR